MKAIAVAFALILSASGAARAGDAPTAFSWAGFYAGGYLGGGWTAPVDTPDATNPATVVGLSTYPPGVPMTCDGGTPGLKTGCVAGYGLGPSVIGGATAGYNWQSGKMAGGVEGELGYNRLSGSGIIPYQGGAPCGSTANPCNASVSTAVGGAYGVLAARLGLTGDALNPAWSSGDHALFYLKFGVAVTQISTSETCLASASGSCSQTISFAGSRSVWGPTLGAGVEWALDQHWSVEAEYDYLGVQGSVTACGLLPVGVGGQNGSWCATTSSSGVQTAKVGVNYHF